MTATFLTRLELRDFRTFGHFELDIPPSPGLTLVVGPNGLGKSSFFDAIEWCLTGHIRRFSEYIGRRRESEYLTRRDATADSHSISMTFNSGAQLTRTARSTPDAASLMAVLKKEDWGEIKNLDAYLALTHFLGQAAQQRFTSRNKGDQWQALKGPSGIERLEQVRIALRGRATTSAFNRRLQQQTVEIELATQALSRWHDDSTRLEQLQASALASGTPTAQGIEQDLALLKAACDTTLGKATVLAASDDHNRRIIRLRNMIEEAKSDTLKAQDRIEHLHWLATRYESLTTASDLDGVAASNARQTVMSLTETLTEATLAFTAMETAVSRKAEAEAVAREALDRSSAQISAATALAEINNAYAKLVEQRDALIAPIAAAEQKSTTTEQTLVIAQEQRVRLASLEEQRGTRQHAVERAAQLNALQLEAQLTAAQATNTRAEADTATSLIAQLQTSKADVETQIAAAEADYNNAQRRASDLADALATVAKHLSAHDELCPVCTASYPPGTIKLLAETAARNQDRDLTSKAQALESLRRLLDDTSSRLLVALERSSRANLAQTEAEVAAMAAREARMELIRLLNATDDQDVVILANQRLASTTREIIELEAEIAIAPATVAELQAASNQAKLTYERLTRDLALIDQRITYTLQRITDCREMLGEEAVATGLHALTARNQNNREAFESAQAQLAAARIELAAVMEKEENARQRLTLAETAMAKTQADVAQARLERERLVREWLAAGRPGEPSDVEVAAHSAVLAKRASALDRHEAELNRLVGAVRKLAETDELGSLLVRMEAAAGRDGVLDPSLYERHLIAQLEKARAEHQTTKATQEAVNAYTEQLKEKADRFSANFLEPLNGLIDDFNRALLSTPGETVQFSADAAVNRTSLGMSLRYTDEIDNARYDTKIAPQLVLSEGQMAANGFSILCATSVAYKWSNWRALLLDDPLQHNDIIHAAAFADVMRNLVEYENYQLLMSSHDRAEGEFLFRKFDAADLPCTMVTLTAPSREGVLYEPPRYNAAASQRMAARFTATG